MAYPILQPPAPPIEQAYPFVFIFTQAGVRNTVCNDGEQESCWRKQFLTSGGSNE